LIGNQPVRRGERDNNNTNAAAVEFLFNGLHLAEVSLAGQSGKVPKKN
jgi:hypothetical protein